MAAVAHIGIDSFRAPGESGMAELARGLRGLADAADAYPASLPQVERGFRELAGLAQGCGEPRVRRISLAFASILGKAHLAPEGDLPFILDTAAAFLDALPGKLDRARARMAS